jgi:hypothetical protein
MRPFNFSQIVRQRVNSEFYFKRIFNLKRIRTFNTLNQYSIQYNFF